MQLDHLKFRLTSFDGNVRILSIEPPAHRARQAHSHRLAGPPARSKPVCRRWRTYAQCAWAYSAAHRHRPTAAHL
jgi:hypothetical protein